MASALKHSLDVCDEVVDPKRRRIWGGYIGAVFELPDATDDVFAETNPAVQRILPLLDRLAATRDVYQLLEVLNEAQWPDLSVMDAVNSRALDGLFKAHAKYKLDRSEYGFGFQPPSGFERFFKKHLEYLKFVLAVVDVGTAEAFDFIHQRGVDFSLFSECALRVAIQGRSLACLRKLHEMFPDQWNRCKLLACDIVDGPILEYVHGVCEEKHRDQLLLRAAPCFRFLNPNHNDLTVMAVKLGRPLDRRVAVHTSLSWVQTARKAGVPLSPEFLGWVIQRHADLDARRATMDALVDLAGPECKLEGFLPPTQTMYEWARKRLQWRPVDPDAYFVKVISYYNSDWLALLVADGFVSSSPMRHIFELATSAAPLLRASHRNALRRMVRIILYYKGCIDPELYQNQTFQSACPYLCDLLPSPQ